MGVFLRRLLCAAVACALAAPAAAVASPASPVTDPEAVAEYEAAGTAYEKGNYEAAVQHIKNAYAIEQAPGLLWAWATIERQAGHYKLAAGLYDAFLTQAPDSDRVGEARAYLVEMRALAGEPIAPELPKANDDVVEPDDDPNDDPDEDVQSLPPDGDDEEVSGLKGEKLAPALLGVGAVVAITGGVLMGLGRSRVSASPDQPTEDAYFAEIDVGRNVYFGGAATLGAGGLILIGGAIRYAIVARRGKAPKSNASAMVMRHGFGLNLSGRF